MLYHTPYSLYTYHTHSHTPHTHTPTHPYIYTQNLQPVANLGIIGQGPVSPSEKVRKLDCEERKKIITERGGGRRPVFILLLFYYLGHSCKHRRRGLGYAHA